MTGRIRTSGKRESEFADEFIQALDSGKANEPLWEIVRRHRNDFADVRDIYGVLEQIWLEYGFDTSAGGGIVRDELEFVMEKAWYGNLV